jgi:hypothetical protein
MSVRSAHLTLREWTDPQGALRALQRHREVPPGAWDAFGDTPHELTSEHWFSAPGRVREERAGYVGVRDGDRWWVRHPDGGLVTNEGRSDLSTSNASIVLALLDPASILAQLELDERAAGNRAGRPTIECAATAKPDADRVDLGLVGGDAESWELALDAEHGLLLAAAALLDGTAYQTFEAVSAEFDLTLDPALFAPP